MSRADFAVRTPGGRVMRQVIEAAEQETGPQVESPTRAPIMVGAADDHAERHADEVADRVLARLSASPDTHEHTLAGGPERPAAVRRSIAGPIGVEGGALDEETATDLASARGAGTPLDPAVRRSMESGFDHGLPGDVRLHTDARAARLAAGMNAEAFTQGRDIFFSPGAYDPGSAAGQHLLAHELTHVVQQRDGAVAHRRLRGTAQALTSQGGGRSTKGARKTLGVLTKWDKIVAAVKDYEKKEDKLVGGGKPSMAVVNKSRPTLVKLLRSIGSLIAEWRAVNDEAGQAAAHQQAATAYEQQAKAAPADAPLPENMQDDVRTKAGRRQAIAMLTPRVGYELNLLQSKDAQAWPSSLGLSTQQLVKQGHQDSGALNTVSKMDYQLDDGSTFSGFFKEDKGFNADRTGQEKATGFEQIDPNYGARSVALYRLDQLFNAGVTARAEFAVHTDADTGQTRMGTVLEAATGRKAGDTSFGLDKSHTAAIRDEASNPQDAGAVAMDDPVLQRGLNKLQILDAITGQLDRHEGNYFISTDKDTGSVTGVTGIDLDMAFGKNMKDTRFVSSGRAEPYKELPEYIDEEMGMAILAVADDDIRGALAGLLPNAEIASTLDRLHDAQTRITKARAAGKFKDKESWASGGMRSQSYVDSKSGFASPSYHETLQRGARIDFTKRALALGPTVLRLALSTPTWRNGPTDVYDLVLGLALTGTNKFIASTSRPLADLVAGYVYDNKLGFDDLHQCFVTAATSVATRLNPLELGLALTEGDDQAKAAVKKIETAFVAAIADLKNFYRPKKT